MWSGLQHQWWADCRAAAFGVDNQRYDGRAIAIPVINRENFLHDVPVVAAACVIEASHAQRERPLAVEVASAAESLVLRLVGIVELHDGEVVVLIVSQVSEKRVVRPTTERSVFPSHGLASVYVGCAQIHELAYITTFPGKCQYSRIKSRFIVEEAGFETLKNRCSLMLKAGTDYLDKLVRG